MADNTKDSLEGFVRAAQDTLVRLYCRWQDEKDYEDIKDYLDPLQPIAAVHNVTLVRMTKRPFGLSFRIGERRFGVKLTRAAGDRIAIMYHNA